MLSGGVQAVKVAPAARGSRAARGRVLLLVLATAGFLQSMGCFSTRYPGLMDRHLEVMTLYARKLDELAADERTVAPQDWGEFTYPLKRARDFATIAAGHYPERASLRSFQTAIERYAELVADPRVLVGPDAAQVVRARAAAFLAAAEATRDALRREGEDVG